MRKKHEPHYAVKSDDKDFIIEINEPIIIKIPITPANKKLLIVLLRLIYSILNKPYFTFQNIADIMKLNDRRDIDNFYREFKKRGCDFLQYLSRHISLSKYVELIENIVIENPILNFSEIYDYFKHKYPSVKMSLPSFTKYFSQINAHAIWSQIHKMIDKNCIWKKSEYIEYLSRNIDIPFVEKKIVDMTKKEQKKTVKKDSQINVSTTKKCYLIMFLIGSGVAYSTIRTLTGFSKSYINELAYKISNIKELLLTSIVNYSGLICVDEKYIKLDGVFHYVFSIVDAVSGIPLLVEYYKEKTALNWAIFFEHFKRFYGVPNLIISDGCHSLNKGRTTVFPKVKHQYCKFHKIKNLIKRLYANYSEDSESKEIQKIINKLKQVFSRDTRDGRKKALNELAKMLPNALNDYFLKHFVSVWKNLTLSFTSNAVERWNRKIKKIVSGKYGLKRPETITLLLNCLWFKELIEKGVFHINPESAISKINIPLICQEVIANRDLDGSKRKDCA